MAITYGHTFPEGVFEVHNTKPPFPVQRVKQIHSDLVLTIDSQTKNLEIIGTGDGIIDLEKKHNLAVLTADCTPILFLGKIGNAMVHAGWAGIKNQIALDKKIQELDVHTIFLGPHIRLKNFEVQENFKDHFTDMNFYHQHEGKLFFDLTAKLVDDLKKTYPTTIIIDCLLDTRDDENFYSYRRNKTEFRNWNVFKIKQENL